jgi:hypothetical protein
MQVSVRVLGALDHLVWVVHMNISPAHLSCRDISGRGAVLLCRVLCCTALCALLHVGQLCTRGLLTSLLIRRHRRPRQPDLALCRRSSRQRGADQAGAQLRRLHHGRRHGYVCDVLFVRCESVEWDFIAVVSDNPTYCSRCCMYVLVTPCCSVTVSCVV